MTVYHINFEQIILKYISQQKLFDFIQRFM